MHFTISREALLPALQLVAGVVERRQTMAVLSNILLVLQGQELSLTGTDTEVELVGRVTLDQPGESGEITVPARKLMDICKSLPSDAQLNIELDDHRLVIKSGRSQFTLTTLPAADFPSVEESAGSLMLNIEQKKLRHLIERTSFAMAQQDVRYYLNGLLLEVRSGQLRAVATDGHRLAMCEVDTGVDRNDEHQIIVPRKGVLELARLMSSDSEHVNLVFGSNHIRATTPNFTFTSKLVDGKFPDYERVLPQNSSKLVTANRLGLKDALTRASILSNEKYRGIRLDLENNLLRIEANNPEQEQAKEEVAVEYLGEPLNIGFNVSYLLDVLNVMTEEQVVLRMADANSSTLLQEASNANSSYVVMPMRI